MGWFISNAQANSREIRKEKRSEVDACCDLASELLEKSRTYFGRAPDDESPGEAADLSFSVMRLLKRLERLERQHDGFKVSEAGGDLFDAVTGGDFESAARTKKGPADVQIRKIEEAVHRVIDDLETGFEKEFKTWRQQLREKRKARKSWRV